MIRREIYAVDCSNCSRHGQFAALVGRRGLETAEQAGDVAARGTGGGGEG